MRKIEKIQTLDQQTSQLKSENEELASLAKKLKDQVNIMILLYYYLVITIGFLVKFYPNKTVRVPL